MSFWETGPPSGYAREVYRKKLLVVVVALFVWFQIGGGAGAVGQRSRLVEHASTPAGGTRSHAAAWNIPLQAGPADTQVPSAVEGKTFSVTQLCIVINIYIFDSGSHTSWRALDFFLKIRGPGKSWKNNLESHTF